MKVNPFKKKNIKITASTEASTEDTSVESSKRSLSRTAYDHWMRNKTSIRRSINAKCFDCVGRENSTRRIRFCTIFTCPLWYVRPYRKNITQDMCLEYDETHSTYISTVKEATKRIIPPKKKILLKK